MSGMTVDTQSHETVTVGLGPPSTTSSASRSVAVDGTVASS